MSLAPRNEVGLQSPVVAIVVSTATCKQSTMFSSRSSPISDSSEEPRDRVFLPNMEFLSGATLLWSFHQPGWDCLSTALLLRLLHPSFTSTLLAKKHTSILRNINIYLS
jgi:hypothetical protein